ncbi:MAG: hypothetical protein QOG26_1654 [Solirubrobacterales bacterium]|jgi:sulfoxide reductase heme-binding subunit YedZ|nr:hypothetical protein [Solirubrobacterales bacterium]
MNAGTHLFWITSRAAGTAAIVAASASVTVGILLGRRRSASLTDLRALHEALSLLTLALIGVHGLSLLGDHFLRPGLAGILIPFDGSYRPVWTGLGIIGGYGLAALGLSYYLRDAIGPSRWRRLHQLTALFWALGVAHSIGGGSDGGTAWFLLLGAAAVLPAAAMVLGRTGSRFAQILNLPREHSPVRTEPAPRPLLPDR